MKEKLIIRHRNSLASLFCWPALFLMCALLAGCAAGTGYPGAGHLEKEIVLESPIAQDFPQNLAASYQYYYMDRDQIGMPRALREIFYNKSVRALSGESVPPAIVPDSIEPPALHAQLLDYREVLSQQLSRRHRPGDIQILAQSQAAFDCMLLLAAHGNPAQDSEEPDRQMDRASSLSQSLCYNRFNALILRLEKPLWPKLEYNIFFQRNRSVLTKEAISQLQEISRLKKKDPQARLVIAGHSDSRGSAEANHRIAVQRARAVRNLLMQFGVKADSLLVEENVKKPPALFSLGNDISPDRQRRVTVLVERNLVY